MISKFFKTALFFAFAVTLVSCDKDYNEIGTDLVGDDHYQFVPREDMSIAASNHLTGPVQANGQTIVPFGVYNDGGFGKTTANFVTQLELASANPTLTDLVDIDSVRLYVPYNSTYDKTENNVRIHKFNELHGDAATKLNLQIYENQYFLRSQEVVDNQTQAQSYFNDMDATIDAAKAPTLLNDAPSDAYDAGTSVGTVGAENTQFYFKNTEYKLHKYETDVNAGDTNVVAQLPGMYLKLNKAYFKNRILQAPAGMLANNNVFKNYFRGLYFKVSDPSTAKGVLNMMNFTGGAVTIYYRRNITVTNTTTGVSETKPRRFEMKLNMTGNSVTLLNYDNPPTLVPNRIVIKGGEGSIAAVDIISQLEREQMVAEDWMINEANLTFHVDEVAMAGRKRPDRIYLYDMTHNQPLVDYSFDTSTDSDPKKIKKIYSGLIDSSKVNGIYKFFYKVRITNYVRSLIAEPDSTRVRIGVSALENIGESSMVKTKNPIVVPNADGTTTSYNKVPKSSVIHPFGVILHGPESEDVADRLKLRVYYTKPD
ncbi:DUF4270 domain-containing protein [Flavobacterium sp.]|uniref:DUF4270 domain-containing protein n=1 Tax=Flavobacterium sp. TaxID=239 RepID=UPI0011F772C8|nr:DUF4270 domain-containing protein [Flavobacterium sp.]RZJ73304.1 MAG: DUF4270 domain-containing protein [Flavobacterium sp.]